MHRTFSLEIDSHRLLQLENVLGLYDVIKKKAEFMNVEFLLRIILSIFRVEVSIDNVYIINQFQTIFALGGGGGIKSVIGDFEKQ
jgi:hypothetical protein